MPCTNTNQAVRRHRTRGAGELVYIQRRRVARLCAADAGRDGIDWRSLQEVTCESTRRPRRRLTPVPVRGSRGAMLKRSSTASRQAVGPQGWCPAAMQRVLPLVLGVSLRPRRLTHLKSSKVAPDATQQRKMKRRCRLRRDNVFWRQHSSVEGPIPRLPTNRPIPFSRLPSPQKSSRLVAAVAGNSRHVAGTSRACGGLLRCFSRHSGTQRSFLRRKNRIVGGCLRIYVRSSGGDVHNAPSGCRTAEICRMFD